MLEVYKRHGDRKQRAHGDRSTSGGAAFVVLLLCSSIFWRYTIVEEYQGGVDRCQHNISAPRKMAHAHARGTPGRCTLSAVVFPSDSKKTRRMGGKQNLLLSRQNQHKKMTKTQKATSAKAKGKGKAKGKSKGNQAININIDDVICRLPNPADRRPIDPKRMFKIEMNEKAERRPILPSLTLDHDYPTTVREMYTDPNRCINPTARARLRSLLKE